MSALDKSLSCLRNPVTLFSITLLLVNDHVFKIVAPSWLTGKLSDFAGLFFFPFVLAALLGLALDRLHLPARCTGVLAFGITAIWFTFIKLAPPANASTIQVLDYILGTPVQIVLDPSDLIALPILIPAWRLWLSAMDTHSNRLGWAVLAIA